MTIRKASLIALFLLLAGCTARYAGHGDIRRQIDVFGVQPYSATDYREIQGVKAEEEPCLRGYERTFDALDIIIGYGFNGKVRKITTRNPATAMFGIRPGMTFKEGRARILREGFREDVTPAAFSSGPYSLTFLVDDKDTIFGLTLLVGE
jgi:hypothetical protein